MHDKLQGQTWLSFLYYYTTIIFHAQHNVIYSFFNLYLGDYLFIGPISSTVHKNNMNVRLNVSNSWIFFMFFSAFRNNMILTPLAAHTCVMQRVQNSEGRSIWKPYLESRAALFYLKFLKIRPSYCQKYLIEQGL